MGSAGLTLLISAAVLVACAAPAASPAPTATGPAPEPQSVEFRTASGVAVTGRYYPAPVQPAPVIVLMHGGGGSIAEWTATGTIAWLQHDNSAQADIFPPLPADLAPAVLVFDFRGNWLEAGRAAVAAARELPGADPQRIATIGASAGADSAAAACRVAGCVGALALSPMGSFDGVRFGDTVAALDLEGKAVWCLATTGDHGCPPASGAHYREFVYPGSGHGTGMFIPGSVPEAGRVTLAFLECVFAGHRTAGAPAASPKQREDTRVSSPDNR